MSLTPPQHYDKLAPRRCPSNSIGWSLDKPHHPSSEGIYPYPTPLTPQFHRWIQAQWQLAVTRFIADLGGNWIASTPEAEADIVGFLNIAEILLPFGDWDASLLRMALLEAAHGERVTFEKHLQRGKLRLRFRRRLRTWVERCDCNLRRPKLKSCEPHQAITAMEKFTILIDREWYRLAKWYHLPPETVSAERDDVKHYFLHADPENYDLARLDRAAQGGKPEPAEDEDN
jgi:hypothetical protein